MVNLIERLVQDLGVSTEQAEGGAGLLLSLAQSHLDKDQFIKVADSIPAISDIIGKAPRQGIQSSAHLWIVLSRLWGGLGGLSVVAGGFAGLGLDKALIPQFANTLLDFFEEQGGPEVKMLLQAAFR